MVHPHESLRSKYLFNDELGCTIPKVSFNSESLQTLYVIGKNKSDSTLDLVLTS